jgi:hypothetical protein
MIPRPKELWLGELDVSPDNRVLVPGGAKTSKDEVTSEMEAEYEAPTNPSFHCYVERRRCRECAFLKDGPIVGPLKKVAGASPSWCDYWACYGAEPEGYCNHWRKP